MGRQIDFGVEVKDIITGFQGVVTGRVSYITGCDQYLVQPKVDKEGKHIASRWIDEPRLEIIESGRKVELIKSESVIEDPGACEPAPIK